MFTIGSRPAASTEVEEAVALLRTLTTGTLGHMTDFGYAHGLQPLSRPAKAVGRAFTVRVPGLDGTILHYALTLIEPGEFLVIDTSTERLRGLWGGVVAHAAARIGVAGVAVDGPVVDWEELLESGVPVWCTGTTSLTGRRLGLEGQLLGTIQVGGAVVRPGDVIFADSDGMYAIPAEEALETARRVAEREAKEPGIKLRIDAGERLADITGVTQMIEEGAG